VVSQLVRSRVSLLASLNLAHVWLLTSVNHLVPIEIVARYWPINTAGPFTQVRLLTWVLMYVHVPIEFVGIAKHFATLGTWSPACSRRWSRRGGGCLGGGRMLIAAVDIGRVWYESDALRVMMLIKTATSYNRGCGGDNLEPFDVNQLDGGTVACWVGRCNMDWSYEWIHRSPLLHMKLLANVDL